MNAISTRTATLKDLETLLDFEQGVIEAERPLDPFLEKGEICYYNIPELISAEHIHLILAICGEEIVGSLMGTMVFMKRSSGVHKKMRKT